MDVEPKQSLAVTAGKRPLGEPTLEDRLIARMLAPWHDEELARGMGASLAGAHAARAEQLTGECARRAVACSLDKLVERTQNPRPAGLILLSPRPEQVRDAMPLILSIRSRLLSQEALAAQGIAGLKSLLIDRRGSCYIPSRKRALTVALHDISELLDVEQMTP